MSVTRPRLDRTVMIAPEYSAAAVAFASGGKAAENMPRENHLMAVKRDIGASSFGDTASSRAVSC
jgi:hypothetical protein